MTDVLEEVFDGLAKRLKDGFDVSAAAAGETPTRVSSNREWLVQEFLSAVLPVSVESRLGAVLIDSLGQHSRDTDIVLLNPWATPVWPFLHGVVPVEGVLAAVYVERDWPPRTHVNADNLAPVFTQLAQAKGLLKWLSASEGYAVQARRTYRVETGMWAWLSPVSVSPKDVLTVLLKSWSPFESALVDSCKKARQREWTSPAPIPERMDADYEDYQRRVGAMAPNWMYLHQADLLMVKFQARAGRELCTFEDLVLVTRSPDGVVLPPDQANGEPVEVRESRELASEENRWWGYAFFRGERALRTLAFQLAFATDLYGKERANYAEYLKG